MNQHPTDWLKIFIVQCYKQFEMIKSYSFIYLMLFISYIWWYSFHYHCFLFFFELLSFSCCQLNPIAKKFNWNSLNWIDEIEMFHSQLTFILFDIISSCDFVNVPLNTHLNLCDGSVLVCVVLMVVAHKLFKPQHWMWSRTIQHNVFNGWYACTFLLSFWFVSSFSEWNFFILVWLSSFDWLDCCLTLTHWFVDSTKSLVPWSLLSSFSAWQCNKLIFCHC